jgi:hypothetical protein
MLEGDGRVEGLQIGNILASYVHLHLGHSPSMAPRFVEVCRRFDALERANERYGRALKRLAGS